MSKKGGAVSKKMKKYPRIPEYLEAHHKNIYDIVDSLAMFGAFTPRRGTGRTFLLPDSSYVKKIEKQLESDEPEKAADMISSLIIADFLPTLKDWAAKKDDIPNMLGQKVQVEKVNGNTVHLVGGGKLTLDKKFVPFERLGKSIRNNIVVWSLKGEVPYGSDVPAAEYKYTRLSKKSNGKKGGVETAGAKLALKQLLRLRLKVWILQCGQNADKDKADNPCIQALASLVEYARDKTIVHNGEVIHLDDVLRVIIGGCPDTGSLMNVLECLSDDVVAEWAGSDGQKALVVNQPVSVLLDWLKNLPVDRAGDAMIYGGKQALDDIENAKTMLRDSMTMSRLKAPEQILAAEKSFAQTNSIGSIQKVNPPAAHKYVFGNNPERKALFDERRFVCQTKLRSLLMDPLVNECDIDRVLELLGGYKSVRYLSSQYWNQRKCNEGPLFHSTVVAFLESGYFLATARSKQVIGADEPAERASDNPYHMRSVNPTDTNELVELQSNPNQSVVLTSSEIARVIAAARAAQDEDLLKALQNYSKNQDN